MSGGIFSIFVSDLCKGCAACVTACGDHQALKMVQETEEVNAEHESGTAFLNLLPDTPQKYLGLYNDSRPQDSKTATLRNMLMVRRNLNSDFVGGAYVFPGGSVDSADADIEGGDADFTDDHASRRLALPAGGLAYYVACLREV